MMGKHPHLFQNALLRHLLKCEWNKGTSHSFAIHDCATAFISTHLMAMSPISERKAPTAIPDTEELASSAERQPPRPPPAPAEVAFEVAFPSSQTHPVWPRHASGLASAGHPAKHVVPGILPPHHLVANLLSSCEAVPNPAHNRHNKLPLSREGRLAGSALLFTYAPAVVPTLQHVFWHAWRPLILVAATFHLLSPGGRGANFTKNGNEFRLFLKVFYYILTSQKWDAGGKHFEGFLSTL